MMPHSVSFRNESRAENTKVLLTQSRKGAKKSHEHGLALCAFAALRERSSFCLADWVCRVVGWLTIDEQAGFDVARQTA
jgi:hypothetical protein